ncbi:dTDP-4-dehydrorhamnose 3,5-epimerase [Prochlorococcus marinus]|nr:dTDP-4-dehydrorhamnose 3,5-epimerase [Prochlorococcus marinus]
MFEGLYLLKPKVFNDDSGYFMESWNRKIILNILKKDIDFCQDNLSFSKQGVLRGLHFQKDPFAQDKLVSCIQGSIFDVAVDLRSNSKTFGKWVGVFLNDRDNEQLFIPKGFANGFLTLSESAYVKYKTTEYYSFESERYVIWNDKVLKIRWPLNKINFRNPIVSKKDSNGDIFEKDFIYFK